MLSKDKRLNADVVVSVCVQNDTLDLHHHRMAFEYSVCFFGAESALHLVIKKPLRKREREKNLKIVTLINCNTDSYCYCCFFFF